MNTPLPTGIASIDYTTRIPGGSHWSLRLRRGTILRLIDLQGGANVGMLLYNPESLLERYNAPDTLKAQHTFRITVGHCLYSDMGRIFASVIEDGHGWHDTVCGNAREADVRQAFGPRDYQRDRNRWRQNGHDAFLVELAKYGLGLSDLAANLNWFSRVEPDAHGALTLRRDSTPPSCVTLRIEMDTLVVLHTCPHPLHPAGDYPHAPIQISLGRAAALTDDDVCRDHCDENRRGFDNNALYHLSAVEPPAFPIESSGTGETA